MSNEIDNFMNSIDRSLSGKPAQSSRYCTKCGRQIPMDSKFCPYCGNKFEDFKK